MVRSGTGGHFPHRVQSPAALRSAVRRRVAAARSARVAGVGFGGGGGRSHRRRAAQNASHASRSATFASGAGASPRASTALSHAPSAADSTSRCGDGEAAEGSADMAEPGGGGSAPGTEEAHLPLEHEEPPRHTDSSPEPRGAVEYSTAQGAAARKVIWFSPTHQPGASP